MDDVPENGYQLKDFSKIACDVGVEAHSPTFLHLLRMQWEDIWVDPLDQRNSKKYYDSEVDYNHDLYGDVAMYGPDFDDIYGMW